MAKDGPQVTPSRTNNSSKAELRVLAGGGGGDGRLNAGIEPGSPALQADYLPSKPPGMPSQGPGQVKLRIKMVNCRKMSWRESS